MCFEGRFLRSPFCPIFLYSDIFLDFSLPHSCPIQTSFPLRGPQPPRFPLHFLPFSDMSHFWGQQISLFSRSWGKKSVPYGCVRAWKLSVPSPFSDNSLMCYSNLCRKEFLAVVQSKKKAEATGARWDMGLGFRGNGVRLAMESGLQVGSCFFFLLPKYVCLPSFLNPQIVFKSQDFSWWVLVLGNV